MTTATGFVTLHGKTSSRWDVLVSEETLNRQRNHVRNSYVGVFERGLIDEPLFQVMLRALARHKANLLVIGKFTEQDTKTYFIDHKGKVYSPTNN